MPTHLTLPIPDATTMGAYLARPSGPGPHPGLLVIQEAFGVNSQIRSIADRFAAEGFVAIAPEMFHRTVPPGFEGDYNDFPAVRPHLEAMTFENNELDLRAAFDHLAADPTVDRNRIAAVGFCMGGRCAFLANTILPLAASVSYYGGNIAPALLHRVPALSGPQLLFWAGKDERILPEHYRAVEDSLRAAGKRYASVVFSHADHGFFSDERTVYDTKAAAESWELTLAFLRDYVLNA